jgi:hypothetical protein
VRQWVSLCPCGKSDIQSIRITHNIYEDVIVSSELSRHRSERSRSLTSIANERSKLATRANPFPIIQTPKLGVMKRIWLVWDFLFSGLDVFTSSLIFRKMLSGFISSSSTPFERTSIASNAKTLARAGVLKCTLVVYFNHCSRYSQELLELLRPWIRTILFNNSK